MSQPKAGEPQELSLWLITGILTLPVIFVWFLLRPGYSSNVRIGGFALAFIPIILLILAGIFTR